MLSRERTGRGQRRVCEAQAGVGCGGGAKAADRVEVAVDVARVAGEAHANAIALDNLESGGPHHLALLAVHVLVAGRKGLVRPRV